MIYIPKRASRDQVFGLFPDATSIHLPTKGDCQTRGFAIVNFDEINDAAKYLRGSFNLMGKKLFLSACTKSIESQFMICFDAQSV